MVCDLSEQGGCFERDRRTVPFDGVLIVRAIQKAFLAELGLDQADQLDETTLLRVRQIAGEVVGEAPQSATEGRQLEVEQIQDASRVNRTRRRTRGRYPSYATSKWSADCFL